MLAVMGIGDMRLLLQQYLAGVMLLAVSESVTGGQAFGQFTSPATGLCSLMVRCDTPAVYLYLTDVTLDNKPGGVDNGQYLPVSQWQVYQFVAVAGHTYQFTTNINCSIALVVVSSPLIS